METALEQCKACLQKQFGKDMVLALATVDGTIPCVRSVDGYYEDGAFYVVTYASSAKMLQIAANPTVAICGEWMTAHAIGENLGWVLDPQHQAFMEKLRQVFAAWYTNGDVNENDPQTVLLRLRLTDVVIHSEGQCHTAAFSL